MKILNKINFKKIILFSLLTVILVNTTLSVLPSQAFAETEEEKGKSNTVNQGITNGFMTEPRGQFKNGNTPNNYNLDMVTERDAERVKKDSVWADIKDGMFGSWDIAGNAIDTMNLGLNLIVNTGFKMNILMTSMMITVLEFSFEVDIIGKLVEGLESSVKRITGISNGVFSGNGMFGSLLKIITVLTVGYMLFVYVVKRAFLESLGTLMKTVLTLALALLIFSNYSTFIKASQGLSNELTAVVLGMGNWQTNETPNIDGSFESTGIKDSFWGLFVDRPYLFMQYGTHRIDEIKGGEKRVKELLALKSGDSRNEYVLDKEVKDRGNELMVSSSVLDRLAFSPFYLILNIIVSLPVYALSLSLIVLQFWFLIISAIAPFALIMASIPGFFGVLKRYAIEFSLPLILKVFISFVTLMLLTFSEALYGIRLAASTGKGSFIDYIFILVFQFILFISLFLLRNRIMGIFTQGSEAISNIRDSSGSMNPLTYAKKGVQGTAMAAGATVGAAYGGVQGAAMGASMGSSLGNIATGENAGKELGSASKTFAQMKYMKDNSKNTGTGKESNNAIVNTESETASGTMPSTSIDSKPNDDLVSMNVDTQGQSGIHTKEADWDAHYANLPPMPEMPSGGYVDYSEMQNKESYSNQPIQYDEDGFKISPSQYKEDGINISPKESKIIDNKMEAPKASEVGQNIDANKVLDTDLDIITDTSIKSNEIDRTSKNYNTPKLTPLNKDIDTKDDLKK